LNSNFYLTDAALDLLADHIDIYLPDLKFGPPRRAVDCGAEIGGMPHYWETVTGCIERVQRQGKRVIVRHLLMPGHFECCTLPVLHWLAAQPGIEVSLLTQYVAPPHAKGVLAAPLDAPAIQLAMDLAQRLRLTLVA
ncbi:MAG: hypothetical protein KDD84_24070, partial [Caldilineaceae bacterium]|nr:hypothetical protein [Caldilineaceae bacterium]